MKVILGQQIWKFTWKQTTLSHWTGYALNIGQSKAYTRFKTSMFPTAALGQEVHPALGQACSTQDSCVSLLFLSFDVWLVWWYIRSCLDQEVNSLAVCLCNQITNQVELSHDVDEIWWKKNSHISVFFQNQSTVSRKIYSLWFWIALLISCRSYSYKICHDYPFWMQPCLMLISWCFLIAPKLIT